MRKRRGVQEELCLPDQALNIRKEVLWEAQVAWLHSLEDAVHLKESKLDFLPSLKPQKPFSNLLESKKKRRKSKFFKNSDMTLSPKMKGETKTQKISKKKSPIRRIAATFKFGNFKREMTKMAIDTAMRLLSVHPPMKSHVNTMEKLARTTKSVSLFTLPNTGV